MDFAFFREQGEELRRVAEDSLRSRDFTKDFDGVVVVF